MGCTRLLLALATFALAAVPNLAVAQSPVDFDGMSAPCNFSGQNTPATSYAGSDVTLLNNFEVLNQCGNFGISGHSSPNFLAWNGGSRIDQITFSIPMDSVAIGYARGGTWTLTAKNSGGTTLQTLVVTGSNTMQTASFSASGIKTVDISATGNIGVIDNITYTATAPNVAPTANAGGPYTGGQTAAIALNGSGSTDSDGSITLYEWDCTNDGSYDASSASATASTCTYPDDGTYALTLRVTDDDGAQDTASTTVTVTNALPTAAAGGPYSGGQLNAIALDGSGSGDTDGSIALYAWDCTTDGSYDVLSPSPTGSSCTYLDDGTYTVTLQVTDDDGGQATDTATVTVTNALPTADAGGPYSVGQGSPGSLDGSGSSDSDGSITQYEWDCTTDGSYDVTSSSPTGSTCTYPTVGSETVTLRVTDDDGGQATDTATVTVTNALPTADAGGPYSGDEGAAIAVDGSGSSDSDGTISTWEWDCDTDGVYELSASSATGNSCTYGDEGTYTVSLRVTDNNGGQATDTAPVTVSNVAPVLSNLTVPNGDEGSTLSFSVTGTDVAADSLTYTWDFGDSTTGTGANATHAYADDGSFSVTVTVDDGTDTSTLSGTATIANVDPEITSSAPTVATEGTQYTYAPVVTDPGAEVFAWSLSPGAPTGMTVDGGTGALEWTPTYDQAVVGSFSLVLSVDDGDAGTDAQSWTVAVSWLDSDSDGLPDGWETPNGLDPTDPSDATGDPDADGLTNLDEFAGGTDPNSFDGPTAPTAFEPVGGVEVSSDTPDLVVDNASDPQGDALTYDFEVYSDASLTTLVTSTVGVAETPTQTLWKVDISLAENGEYWWRARASDGLAYSPWTTEESFVVNTINEAPDAPILSYPVDDETVSSLTPTLLWQEAADPDGDLVTYDVEVYDSTGALIDSGTGIVGDGSEGQWPLPFALAEDATYSWTARAVDDNGAMGDWADEESFFVSSENGAPDGPVFTDPVDGSPVATVSPTLVATEVSDPEGDELTYEFSIDTVASFDSPDLVEATLAATGTGSVTWDLAEDGTVLPENGLVYARVRAVDPGGVASVPDTISFFVRGANDAPTVPVLIAPQDATTGDESPIFEVADPTDVEGDLIYVEFLVARDEGLADVIVQTDDGIVVNGTGSTTWSATDGFMPGTVYWTARAVDAIGTASEWAAPWSYTIEEQASGDDDDSAGGGGGGAGCDCESSLATSPVSGVWLLLLALVPVVRRRR